MFRLRKKDVALVAFATGLLAFEAAALQEAVPAVKRSLARLAGLSAARIAERIVTPAGALASASMMDGAGRAAQAAMGVAKATALRLGEPAVAGSSAGSSARSSKSCMKVVVDGADVPQRARIQAVTVTHETCRARARAAADRAHAEAIRRAITERRHTEAFHRAIGNTVEISVETTVETSSS